MASKIFFTALILLLTAFIALSADDPQTTGSELPFDIGDTLPDSITIDEENCIWEELDPIFPTFILSCPITAGGITYYYGIQINVGPEKPPEIPIIIVKDPEFETPELLSVGGSMTQALTFSNGEIIRMYPCCKVYVKLPSGWNAAYKPVGISPCNSNAAEKSDSLPITERKIDYLFKMQTTAGYTDFEEAYKVKLENY
jgi:hypothetical protein